MPNLAWLTDIHLDFVDSDKRRRFFRRVADTETDAVLITGDIGEAHSVEGHLTELSAAVARPVYFVLGNHDYYTGSIRRVRESVLNLCAQNSYLHYLSNFAPIGLSSQTALVGHDGWADGRYGDYGRSEVLLNDYMLIEEFLPPDPRHHEAIRSKAERLFVMNRLAQEAADHFARVLPDALASHPQLLLLTHVPPFQEVCSYKGVISDNNFLPHFASKVVGEVLTAIIQQHPENQLIVLCGHTHGGGEAKILPNLTVQVGPATYGQPRIQNILSLP